MKWYSGLLIACLLMCFAGSAMAQKSPAAKQLFRQALADTTARLDSVAAEHFMQAAREELKIAAMDVAFAARSFQLAGDVFLRAKIYLQAHDAYYLSIEQYRKLGNNTAIFTMLGNIGTIYDDTKYGKEVYNFPVSANQETIIAYRMVRYVRSLSPTSVEVLIDGGSNDGLYKGAEGTAYGKYRTNMKDRSNTVLGSATIANVTPNYSRAIIQLSNPADTVFYRVYEEDMVAIPIRFPKKPRKDIFLEVSLLNIRFVDNSRAWLAHPRTLMYYSTPQLEKEVYEFMRQQILEIYDMLKDDTSAVYTKPVEKGRFKGKSMMQAMQITKTDDLKAFLGFVRSFPGKYMGGTWKISETYATWIINNCPVGSNELMDSLQAAKSEAAFQKLVKDNEKEIRDNFFERWVVDAQDFGFNKQYEEAYKWNAALRHTSDVINDAGLRGWGMFNLGRIQDENDKDSLAVESYKKAKVFFEQAGELQGQSFCVNNIGFIYSAQYKYKEAQQLYEEALQLRLRKLAKDTSDDSKIDVARAYLGLAATLYKQNKYPEAIEQYRKGVAILQPMKVLNARKNLADLYKWIGKSYEQMSDYKQAAAYYQFEYTIQKALGDEESQADALDNQGFLVSKVGQYRESYDLYLKAYNLHMLTGEKNDAGFSMSSMGQVLWSLGKYDSAIVAHKSAIAWRRAANNKKGEAYSWKKLGGLYKESGDAQKSIEAYNTALELYKSIDDKNEYGELLQDLGSNYNKIKDYAGAVKYYQQALQLYHEMKDRNKEASILSDLGNVYYADKNFAKADEYYVQAISIQQEVKDRSGLLYNYINRGLVAQFFKENYKDAIDKMRIALGLSLETNSESYIAYCQQNIGALYSYLNDYDSAQYYYDKAIVLYKKLGDKSGEADMYINYGYYYNYRGDFVSGRSYFDKALVLGKEINNAYTLASAYSGISALQAVQGKFSEAFEQYKDVLKIYEEKENPWGIAGVYVDMGNTRNRQGEFAAAICYYQRADSIYQVLKLTKPRATTTNNIGTIYFYQGDYEKAMKQFDQTSKLLQVYNDDPAFMALLKGNIGEVYLEQKKYPEAEKWLTESMQMARKQANFRTIYMTGMLLGRLKAEKNDIKAAQPLFVEADSMVRKINDKTSIIQLLESWGRMLYMAGQLPEADRRLQECITLSKEIGYKNYMWKALSALSDVKIAQNKNEEAIFSLKEALVVVEDIKGRITGGDEAKKIFASGESVVELYQKMVVYLKKMNRIEDALVYMEKASAENLKLRTNTGDITYRDSATTRALTKEKELRTTEVTYEKELVEEKAKPENLQHKEKIAKLEEMKSVAANQYKAFVQDLRQRYPNLQAFKTVDPDEFMARRRDIPADMAVISYLITGKEMSVFVVMKDTIFIKDIPINPQMLQDKISSFYKLNARSGKSIADTSRGGKVSGDNKGVKEDRNQLAADLYDALVLPFIDAIADKQRVAIVPSGFLCFVPFNALEHKKENNKVVYFGEEKQLFYVSKIATVTNRTAEPLTDMRVVAVGNADKSLPNAEAEVKILQAKFAKSLVFLREQATKKNVLGNQGDYNILHLATHGILDYSNATNSYLVLASDPASGDDGKLTIAQIQTMTDIDRFRLITLSACETAVIREVAEGWPISTASAFIEMGVPTVIATLWQVDDKATSILMGKFYDNLKTMDKVIALQEAQSFLKQQPGYENPYYWAPFQLVGLWK